MRQVQKLMVIKGNETTMSWGYQAIAAFVPVLTLTAPCGQEWNTWVSCYAKDCFAFYPVFRVIDSDKFSLSILPYETTPPRINTVNGWLREGWPEDRSVGWLPYLPIINRVCVCESERDVIWVNPRAKVRKNNNSNYRQTKWQESGTDG